MDPHIIQLLQIIIPIMVLGGFSIRSKRRSLLDSQSFISQYYQMFSEFAGSIIRNNPDTELYVKLTLNVTRIHEELGGHGYMEFYQGAYSSYGYQHYALIINTLQNIRSGRDQVTELKFCQDAMLRRLGELESEIIATQKRFKNPIIWFLEGIRVIITFPIRLAYWTGIVEYRSVERLSNSWFVRFASFLTTLIGFIASVIQIMQVWDPSLSFLHKMFPYLWK